MQLLQDGMLKSTMNVNKISEDGDFTDSRKGDKEALCTDCVCRIRRGFSVWRLSKAGIIQKMQRGDSRDLQHSMKQSQMSSEEHIFSPLPQEMNVRNYTDNLVPRIALPIRPSPILKSWTIRNSQTQK